MSTSVFVWCGSGGCYYNMGSANCGAVDMARNSFYCITWYGSGENSNMYLFNCLRLCALFSVSAKDSSVVTLSRRWGQMVKVIRSENRDVKMHVWQLLNSRTCRRRSYDLGNNAASGQGRACRVAHWNSQLSTSAQSKCQWRLACCKSQVFVAGLVCSIAFIPAAGRFSCVNVVLFSKVVEH